MTGNYTDYLGMMLIVHCALLKKIIMFNKFSNNHRNPKASWKTINDILGRSKKQDVIKEIKLPEKTVTSTEELLDVFNEHFINIGPNLAETIQNENDGSFQDFINKQDPEFILNKIHFSASEYCEGL